MVDLSIKDLFDYSKFLFFKNDLINWYWIFKTSVSNRSLGNDNKTVEKSIAYIMDTKYIDDSKLEFVIRIRHETYIKQTWELIWKTTKPWDYIVSIIKNWDEISILIDGKNIDWTTELEELTSFVKSSELWEQTHIDKYSEFWNNEKNYKEYSNIYDTVRLILFITLAKFLLENIATDIKLYESYDLYKNYSEDSLFIEKKKDKKASFIELHKIISNLDWKYIIYSFDFIDPENGLIKAFVSFKDINNNVQFIIVDYHDLSYYFLWKIDNSLLDDNTISNFIKDLKWKKWKLWYYNSIVEISEGIQNFAKEIIDLLQIKNKEKKEEIKQRQISEKKAKVEEKIRLVLNNFKRIDLVDYEYEKIGDKIKWYLKIEYPFNLDNWNNTDIISIDFSWLQTWIGDNWIIEVFKVYKDIWEEIVNPQINKIETEISVLVESLYNKNESYLQDIIIQYILEQIWWPQIVNKVDSLFYNTVLK